MSYLFFSEGNLKYLNYLKALKIMLRHAQICKKSGRNKVVDNVSQSIFHVFYKTNDQLKTHITRMMFVYKTCLVLLTEAFQDTKGNFKELDVSHSRKTNILEANVYSGEVFFTKFHLQVFIFLSTTLKIQKIQILWLLSTFVCQWVIFLLREKIYNFLKTNMSHS